MSKKISDLKKQMLNNYFTIKAVADYLDINCTGFTIGEIYTQEKNKLLIELYNDGINRTTMGNSPDSPHSPYSPDLTLEFSVEKNNNYLILKDISRAKKNYAAVIEEANGQKISGIELYKGDRAIILTLSDNSCLIFTFFSGKANCYLIKENNVINSFKDKKDHYNKSLGELFPAKSSFNTITDLPISAGVFMKKRFPEMGNYYTEEILSRCNINADEQISGEAEEQIIAETEKFRGELINYPNFLLYSLKDGSIMSLAKLTYLNAEASEFPDVNALIVEYIRHKYREEKIFSIRRSKEAEIRGKINNIEKKLKGIQIQLEHVRDSDSFKSIGKAILDNAHFITQGEEKFVYKDEDGKDVTIKLKAELNASGNAQYYFDKYKKQKGSVALLEVKIKKLNKEKSELDSELDRISQINDFKTLIKEEKRSEASKDKETPMFRKFKLNEKYEVWVGKDSASNDLLTTKYASQNDLWFHVRGASGSHTILKTNVKSENIEKEFVQRAAAIAAYYSKARNASSVPVAYCEKKFVKKKKGFKQGSVVMEREKVIFVKPALPEQN